MTLIISNYKQSHKFPTPLFKTMTRIQELASIIYTKTNHLDQFLVSHGQRTPSFDIDGLDALDLPTDLQASRDQIIDATTELRELLQGPKELLLNNSVS